MADTKTSDLTSTTPDTTDILYVVDGGNSRQTTIANLISGSSIATATNTLTLTNKTLTSPTITTPTITNPTVSTGTFTSPVFVTNADLNGVELILDADADTSITADTDDQIDVKIAGADDFRFTANQLNVLSGSTLLISGTLDLNGTELIVDADADSSITADTDDRFDFRLGGSDRFRMGTSDFDIVTATGNIQVAAADPWRTISLPAKSWSPTTTAGCGGPTKVEAGTNDIDYEVLEFDTATDEQAFINFPMPASYDGGVIQFRVFWTNAAGEADDTIEVELSGRSFGNDEAIDQANGTAVAVTDTWIAQGDVHITDWSADVTLAGTPAGNELVHLEIMRDVSGDDLAGDLRVIAVQLRYKAAQYSD